MTRLPTKVPGLDLVLNGGLEQGAVVVVAGAPGTGKTIIAQQICFANAVTGLLGWNVLRTQDPRDHAGPSTGKTAAPS